MSNNNNGINCLEEVLDCNLNEISIDNSCYTVDNNSLINVNLNTFTFMGSTSQFIDGTKINKDDPQNKNRANFQNISLLNCMKKCSQDSECNSIQFNYGSDGNQNEFTENGYCELYVTKSTITGKPVPEQDKKCASTYLIEGNNKMSTENFQVYDDTNSKGLTFTKSKNKPPKVTKLFSSGQGGICRKNVNYNSEPILKQKMGELCKLNPDLEICKTFCSLNSDMCPSTKNILPLAILIFLVFASLVFIVLSFKNKKRNTILKVISIITFIVVTVFLVIHIIKFTKPLYSGNKKDKLPKWYTQLNANQNCQNCTNILGECFEKND
jgi:hypothetical protein